MERSRQPQLALLGAPREGGKANAAGKGNGNHSATDAGSNAPKTDATKLPCFAFQTNSCQYGNTCKYGHVKISKEEFEGIKRKREEALAQRKGKPNGKKG